MKEAIKTAGLLALMVLLADFVGLMAWALSGGMPADGFYIGRISAEIIKLVIN